MVAITDTVQFRNNATATLNNDVLAGDGSIVLTAGQGARFPSLTAGQYFVVTLFNTANGDMEVCNCTARSGDLLTLERAQEGTTAKGFPQATTIVQARVTAGTLGKFVQSRFASSDTGKFLQVNAQGTVDAVVVPPGSTPPGISYLANSEVHTAGKSTQEVMIPIVTGAATLDPILSNAFYLLLDQDATLTLLDGTLSGQLVSLVVQQDALGGRALYFGGNLTILGSEVDTGPDRYTHYSLRWRGLTWLVIGVKGFN